MATHQDWLKVEVRSREQIELTAWSREITRIDLRAPGGYAFVGLPKRHRVRGLSGGTPIFNIVEVNLNASVTVLHIKIKAKTPGHSEIHLMIASCSPDVIKTDRYTSSLDFSTDYTGYGVERVGILQSNASRPLIVTTNVSGKTTGDIEYDLGCKYAYSTYNESYHAAVIIAKDVTDKFKMLVLPETISPTDTLPEVDYMQKQFIKQGVDSPNPSINGRTLHVGKSVINLAHGYEWFAIDAADSKGQKLYVAKSRSGTMVSPLTRLAPDKPLRKSKEMVEFFKSQAALFEGLAIAYQLLAEVNDD